MSDFVKWPSIENSYRDKEIERWLDLYPELANERYVLTEKIHGSNFQIFIQPNQDIKVGSRNNWIDVSGNFQGASIPDILHSHQYLLDDLQIMVDEYGFAIRLFGELFGQGIQKGVDYGKEKRLLFFGSMIDDKLMPFDATEDIVGSGACVPVVGFADSLHDAIEYDTEFDSLLLDKNDNICEGVVIQPYTKVYLDYDGSPFILKKKNDAFKEKQKEPREVVIDSEVARLNSEFRSYVNDNRLQSVFSKEGEIQSPNEIGKYIKFILEDARDDFLKDFGDEFDLLDAGQQKSVLNVGSLIANLLKRYL